MRLNEIADKYGDKVQFLCVYIKEAHAIDENPSPNAEAQAIRYTQPKTADERAVVAKVCMQRYNFSFPMVLDHMSNEVVEQYFAMPDRLYVIDKNGIVAWKCGLGPHYFDANGFEEAVKAIASTAARQPTSAE